MSDTVYDGYRHAGDGATGVADWYLDLIADYGWFPVLTVELIVLVGLVAGAWTAIDRIDERMRRKDGLQQLESYANHPANRIRKEP